MSNGYFNLNVWKKAYRMGLKIYKITKKYPKEETYGLCSQMKRASVSIVGNIAEGYSRTTLPDYIHYITIAIGSCNELEVFLMFSKDLKFIDEDDYNDIKPKQEEILKMLLGLRKSLEKKKSIEKVRR
jgi:four helix bundle protein